MGSLGTREGNDTRLIGKIGSMIRRRQTFRRRSKRRRTRVVSSIPIRTLIPGNNDRGMRGLQQKNMTCLKDGLKVEWLFFLASLFSSEVTSLLTETLISQREPSAVVQARKPQEVTTNCRCKLMKKQAL